MATQAVPQITTSREAFVERLLGAVYGAFDIFTIHLGHRLGYYGLLKKHGPLTSAALAEYAGTDERYVREWVEQQTVAGILQTADPSLAGANRTYGLPAGHDDVLATPESLDFLAPLAQLVVGAAVPVNTVVEAHKTGEGIPYTAYGYDLVHGQSGMNRSMFLQLLGRVWLPRVPDIHQRLHADPPARIADFGCGAGWSGIGMAEAYPNVRVDGYDLDEPSIALARTNAVHHAVSDRVHFQVRDAGDPDLAGTYDLVTALECVHDMSDPVSALATMRRLCAPGGTVLIVDENVAETFAGSGDVDRFMYGFSVLHCLPVGRVGESPEGTGTVMRPDTLRDYADRAGFSKVEVLPIENFFFRFYRLTP